jgi:hypothetical protein
MTDDLFPVRHGMSKFRALNTLNLQSDVYEIEDFIAVNRWKKIDYLGGDSAYYAQVNYKIRTHRCVAGYDNIVLVSFTDDKLYRIHLKTWFRPSDYRKCLENYDQLVKSIKSHFPFFEQFATTNNETGEQVGEGCWLRKSEADWEKMKIREISVSYGIEYEWNYRSYPARKTGNIDRYILEIEYTNLEGTKLDRRGY